MADKKPPLVICPSRTRMLFWAIVSLLFVTVGVLAALFPSKTRTTPVSRFIVTYVGVPFFGLAFVDHVLKLVSRKPELIVTDEGIFHNQALFPRGFIPWEKVEDVYPRKGAYGIYSVRVVLKAPEAVIAYQPLEYRSTTRTDRGKARRRIDITDIGLPLSAEQIYSKMADYMPETLRSA